MGGIISPGLPGIILADNSCRGVIARVLFRSQKYASLNDKAYGHPTSNVPFSNESLLFRYSICGRPITEGYAKKCKIWFLLLKCSILKGPRRAGPLRH